jgi:hypothetical protein
MFQRHRAIREMAAVSLWPMEAAHRPHMNQFKSNDRANETSDVIGVHVERETDPNAL